MPKTKKRTVFYSPSSLRHNLNKIIKKQVASKHNYHRVIANIIKLISEKTSQRATISHFSFYLLSRTQTK